MSIIPNRIIVYPRDVMNITGRGEHAAINLLTKLRKDLKKPLRSLVTVEEFCEYTGIKENQVRPFLKN